MSKPEELLDSELTNMGERTVVVSCSNSADVESFNELLASPAVARDEFTATSDA